MLAGDLENIVRPAGWRITRKQAGRRLLRAIVASLTFLFLLSSLFLPRSVLPFFLPGEDLVLVVAAATSLFFAYRLRPTDWKVLGASVLLSLILLTVGLLAQYSVRLPGGFESSGPALTKEIGRLIKSPLMMVAILTTIRVTAGSKLPARAAQVLLILHLGVGLAQAIGFGPVSSWIETSFNQENVQGFATSVEALRSGDFRATGTVYDPNIYGVVAICLAVAGVALQQAPTLRSSLLPAVAGLACVILSQSRTAFVALVVLAVVAAYTRSGRRSLVIAVVGGALIALLALYFSRLLIGARIGSTVADGGSWFSNRPQYGWLPPLIWGWSPIIGLGLGAVWFRPADSDFLYGLLRTGIVGLVALLAFYAFLLKLARAQRSPAWIFLIVAGIVGATNGFFFGNEVFPFGVLMLAGLLAHPIIDRPAVGAR